MLLKVEAINIDAFVGDAQNLNAVRGKGLLLLDMPEKFEEWLQGVHGEQKVHPLMSGASKAVFKLDTSEASGSVEEEARNWLRDKYCHATIAVASVDDDHMPYFDADERLTAAIRRQQMRSFSFAKVEPLEGAKVCEWDRVRPATQQLKKGDVRPWVSDSTAAGYQYGIDNKGKFLHRGTGEGGRQYTWEMDELSSRPGHPLHHKIAVFHVDGNKLTSRLQKSIQGKPPDKQRESIAKFDLELQGKRDEFRFKLLDRTNESRWQNDKKKRRVEVLVWGGDEFTLVVPAWCGWETAELFCDVMKNGVAGGVQLKHAIESDLRAPQGPHPRFDPAGRRVGRRGQRRGPGPEYVELSRVGVVRSHRRRPEAIPAVAVPGRRPRRADGPGCGRRQPEEHRRDLAEAEGRRVSAAQGIPGGARYRPSPRSQVRDGRHRTLCEGMVHYARFVDGTHGKFVGFVDSLGGIVGLRGGGTVSTTQGKTDLTAWDIRLKMRGPLLTTSSAPLGFGIDAPFARNEAGDYYLAGSLVKGRLKESWREIADTLEIQELDWKRWIGKEAPEAGAEDWDNERGLLQFADFLFQPQGSDALHEDAITYRIQRDAVTHSVRRGQNLMIQTPFAAGGSYWFEGRVWAVATAAEASAIETWMRRGLCAVAGVGAETSVGFGVIEAVEIVPQSSWAKGNGWDRSDGERWTVALAPEGPLCLAGRRLADNIFESETEISGGVIKGALAAFLLRLHGMGGRNVAEVARQFPQGAYSALCAEFSNLRVLHGKPVRKGQYRRAEAIPLSAVKIPTLLPDLPPDLRDAAFTEEPGPEKGRSAPAFQIDWKETGDAETVFGTVRPRFELRVRTQIDTARRRAKDENLFAYRMLAARARTGDGGMDEFEWLTQFRFEGVSEERCDAVKSQLAALLQQYGVPGVGKLKTRCVASRVEAQVGSPRISDKGVHSHEWVVTLQTAALLCDVGEAGPGLSDALEVYRGYWRSISGGVLHLKRMYAEQRLAGGGYLWKGLSRTKLYRPYVLTSAGSTFVLEETGSGAAGVIEGLERSGLPIAETVRKQFDLLGTANDWKQCPYLPQNGFGGEILVDLAWHWEAAL